VGVALEVLLEKVVEDPALNEREAPRHDRARKTVRSPVRASAHWFAIRPFSPRRRY
jgi:hypothetical protein